MLTLRRTCTRCSLAPTFPGLYVLAGHSFGGLYIRSFAAQFPVVLGWGEQLERVPTGAPEFRTSLYHHKPQAFAFEMPGDRQTGLAATDHDRIEQSIL
jgi:hypothetical protein